MAIPHTITGLTDTLTAAPTWAKAAGAAAAFAAAGILVTGIHRVRTRIREAGRTKNISALVTIAALIATTVQASGMWKFFGATMGLPVGFRIFMFSFMEIALLACGLRARGNVEEGNDAGIDGILVWVLAMASGVMSSTDAHTLQEGLMRVLTSFVVALLWSRDLMAAKKAARDAGKDKNHTGPVRWRITKERIAVWLRLADAVDTDIVTIESARQVAKFLRATDRKLNGRRWPFTADARAYRGEMRLVNVALRHGDPTEILQHLSKAKFGEAMNRLGVANANTNTDASDNPAPPIASRRVAPALPPAANRYTPPTPIATRPEPPAANANHSGNLATGDSHHNDNPATATPAANANANANANLGGSTGGNPAVSTGDSPGDKTEALVAATHPVYRQILERNGGKRPTAPQLVDAIDGLNTHSRAKQIRDIVEDRWFPEMKPRFQLFEGSATLAQAG